MSMAYITPSEIKDLLAAEPMTLPIQFPKINESYKVSSPEFRTPLDLEPKLRVRVIGEGIVAKMSGSFGDEDDKVRWTVVLDSSYLEAIE